jgi:shikimate dehydrogenase
MKLLGLIGYPLSHSFSKKYFSQKFENEGLTADWQYELFPIETINAFPELLKSHPELVGLNVTIPFKEDVMQYITELHPTAKEVGAVNCIKFEGEKLIGFNTDYYGFQKSLLGLLSNEHNKRQLKALILGTGGAAKAVAYALKNLNIPYQYVSRSASDSGLTYDEVTEGILSNHHLIINTSPLGMSPHTEGCPSIPYKYLGNQHFLYDLVYNPEVTTFLNKGIQQGAKTKSGLDMLYFQAEKGWNIWNSLES